MSYPWRYWICHLCWSLWQPQILNPMRKARDGIHILTETMLVFFVMIYNYFCFFHYTWFTVFCQFSTVQQGDPDAGFLTFWDNGSSSLPLFIKPLIKGPYLMTSFYANCLLKAPSPNTNTFCIMASAQSQQNLLVKWNGCGNNWRVDLPFPSMHLTSSDRLFHSISVCPRCIRHVLSFTWGGK